MEHIRVACDRGAKVCVCRLPPLVLQSLTRDAAQTHGCHTTRSDVKSGCDADDIEIVVRAVLEVDAIFVKTDDGIVFDVDHICRKVSVSQVFCARI